MADYIRVARYDDIREGEGRVVEVRGKEIGLFKIDGEIHALDNICPHRGGPLAEGIVRGPVVTCPWHAWSFDIRTGVYTDDARLCVHKFPVRVENGEVQVDMG